MRIRVYKHRECPFCRQTESISVIIHDSPAEIEYYASLQLGKYSHTEDWDIDQIFQRYAVVNTNPDSDKHLNYCMRNHIRHSFRADRKIINRAIKMSAKQFIKQYPTHIQMKKDIDLIMQLKQPIRENPSLEEFI